MNLEGSFGFGSEVWSAKIQLIDLIELGKTEEDLFLRLNKRLLQLLKGISKGEASDDDFKIEIISNNKFTVKFFNSKHVTSLIFKNIRESERLSQAKVAIDLCCERTSYSQYEEGKREPSLTKFSEILDAMGFEWHLNIQKKKIA
ncbi:helix-turn-helix domain-containing protein [Silvanigrella paludirubra]|uniref:Helix-turn-helix domain-containing protein n=1 Tax=Silvanigrella paludirubra TaxID=2499159 RepID=A0A6N6VSQ0_9BACT|nr:helix-turn-helix transcriptional regulator [Silvanigrella paludirubra]KAB8035819.1 helix-turn-helix domain-containing protein [Silvanigrella paludirubra]